MPEKPDRNRERGSQRLSEEGAMRGRYSIAKALDHLSGLIHSAEMGRPVKLTRRGRPVAVLVSERDYTRMTGGGKEFWNALAAFRREVDLERLDIGRRTFNGVRASERGRDATPRIGSVC